MNTDSLGRLEAGGFLFSARYGRLIDAAGFGTPELGYTMAKPIRWGRPEAKEVIRKTDYSTQESSSTQ